jgi:hypothetical protein
MNFANSGIMHIGGGPVKISYTPFTGYHVENVLWRFDAMQSGSSFSFQRDVLYPSSGLKGTARKLLFVCSLLARLTLWL